MTRFYCNLFALKSLPFYTATMHTRTIAILSLALCLKSMAHEFPGHTALDREHRISLGTELYAGQRGYWHAGAGVSVPLGDQFTAEIGTHLVREETGAKNVPSFELELLGEFGGGLEIEAFGFGYTRVGRKQAWGAGLRATKWFAFRDGFSVAPFFGPAYARVRAEEASGEIATVHHTMLLAGVTLEAGPVSVTLLGSHSLYNRPTAGLETPVDLESMTHFAAYENNDGFARTTFAAEAACAVTSRLTLHARYAAMQFAGETRHALALTPACKLGERVELTAGIQLLRGGAVENDLVFSGLSVSF